MLTFLVFLALLGWIYLAFGRADFWRATERLHAAPAPVAWPGVVAVMPARDEAASIGAVLASHLACDYPGAFSIIVVDDASTDGTGDMARKAAHDGARDVDVVTAPPLAPGWTGKVAAMQAGVERARATAADACYILFCDADIVFSPTTLSGLVAKAEVDGLALASLMARLDTKGAWGEILIPAFIYFFQKLFPFPQANDPRSSVAAAAGGVMLVRREGLAASGGLEAIRGQIIDDCALAARLKHEGAGAPRSTWIGLAKEEATSLRDNRDLSSVWNMVARSAFAQLDHSWPKLVAVVAGMIVLYIIPVVALLSFFVGCWAEAAMGLAGLAIMCATYRPTTALYDLPAWKTGFLPLAAGLYTAMTVSSALRHQRREGGVWKGRSYP